MQRSLIYAFLKAEILGTVDNTKDSQNPKIKGLFLISQPIFYTQTENVPQCGTKAYSENHFVNFLLGMVMKITSFICGIIFTSALHLSAAAQPVYKVGSTATGNPFTFLDVKTNKVDGMMVDLMNEIGVIGNFKPEIEAIPWGVLIPSLTSGKIQIVSAAMMITPVRAQVIDFTDPIFPYSEGMVVLKSDTTPYKSAKELSGQLVGVQVGTAYFEYLKTVGGFSEIKTYDSIADIVRDVALGRIKAGFVDDPIARYRLSLDKEATVRLVSTYEPKVVGMVGLGVKKGDTALLNTLNSALAKLKAEGRIAKLQEKWGLR